MHQMVVETSDRMLGTRWERLSSQESDPKDSHHCICIIYCNYVPVHMGELGGGRGGSTLVHKNLKIEELCPFVPIGFINNFL